MTEASPRLTSLAHGGGCGCKLSPAVLRDILAGMPAAANFPDLLVGTETADDAAVWRLNDDQALVATTDFFMPIVDDPRDFGRIAATNALSDIYAMGGRPILALAVAGMPVAKLPAETIRAILGGGAEACAAAGVPVVGGHSIDSLEPIYGLVALGLVHPNRLTRNSTGRPGDLLILTKPLGVGVLSAAFRQDRLPEEAYAVLVDSTTRLNSAGPEIAALAGVHAMTDVTGFGLLGHGLEMARGAKLAIDIGAEAPAILPGAEALARAGVRTGAAVRNWESFGDAVHLDDDVEAWRRDLLCDPQTSGGLLIAVAREEAARVLELAAAHGADARAVGRMIEGDPAIRVHVGTFD
ncbi:MAG: selenide, water dikinase SelD [Caulobacteraceae bacterium]|nr:selenide, water dikinase SelD [Caulobacteraceae bacterium]